MIVPALAGWVGIPEGESERTSWTADGRMQYFFKLQNRRPRELRLRLDTSFYDETGAVVDEQGLTTFLEGHRIKPLTVTSNSKAAKRVQVQVSVAD